jgi:hypothetical protein
LCFVSGAEYALEAVAALFRLGQAVSAAQILYI